MITASAVLCENKTRMLLTYVYSLVFLVGMSRCLIMDRTVSRPPKITAFPADGTIFFKLGETAQIDCEANGVPSPTFSWMRNGHLFDPSGNDARITQKSGSGTLLFSVTLEKDEGVYQCFARNDYGVSVSTLVSLRAAKLSKFYYAPPETMYVTNGDSITLPCYPPVSYPPAIISWVIRQNGSLTPIQFDRRVTMGLDGRLRFTNVVPEDALKDGQSYSCMVSNMVSRETVTGPDYHIKVFGVTPVTAPAYEMWKSPSMLVLRGQELNLQLICGGNPTATVQWGKKNGTIHSKGTLQKDGLELVIPDMDLQDAGVYIATCNNTLRSVQTDLRVTVESAPHWTSAPRDVDGHVGDDATIVCETDGIPEAVVHWFVNGVDIDKSRDQRVHSSRFLRPNGTAIVLTQLRETDHMNIQCNATNKYGYTWGDVYINVTPRVGHTPPKVTVFPTDGTIFFKPEEQTEIECEAVGVPPPTYSWTLNDKPFDLSGNDDRITQKQDSGTILFTSISEEDEGFYQCFARNTYGVSMSTKVFLRSARLDAFDSVPILRKVTNGESTTLPCLVPQSMPVPDVNWVIRNRDGGWEPVLLDDRVTMDLEGRLHFTNVVPEDAKSGRPYACKVYNPLLKKAVTGSEYILSIQGDTPITIPASYMWSSPWDWLVLTGEELNLKFICGGNPTPTVQWEKEDNVISNKAEIRNNGLELVIPEVELEDGGIYVATCNNSASEFNQRRFQVLVQSAPHWISAPRDVNGSAGDDATIVCETDGIPEAVVHWYVNGVALEKSQDNRINSSRLLRPNDTAIVLTQLRESDHMNILCNATNRNGFVFGEVSIYVTHSGRKPPRVTVFPADGTIFFKPGEPAQIDCEAVGAPPPTYSWTLNDEPFEPSEDDDRITQKQDSGTILFANISEADQGFYQCFASNTYGVSMSAKVFLRSARLEAFDSEPIIRKITNGDSTTLPCIPPRSTPVSDVSWVIRNRDGSWESVVFDDRITMDLEGRLRFTNVVPADAKGGRPYVCKVYNPLLRQAVTGPEYILTILWDIPITVPAAYMWSSPSDWLAFRGKELKLKFICSGNPTPSVQWEKRDGVIADKAEIRDGGLELVTPEVELEDVGIYVATCNNSASEFNQRSFHVHVHSAPQWISAPPDVNGHVGDDATIVCETDAIPEATVHWYVNGVDIEKSQDERIHSSRFHRPNDTAIVLTQLRESDRMNIQCNVTNRHGYVFGDVSIHVTRVGHKPPEVTVFPADGTIFFIPGEQTKVDCEAVGVPPPTYSWTLNDKPFEPSRDDDRITQKQDSGTILFTSISEADEGFYQCFASNTYGVSMSTKVFLRSARLDAFDLVPIRRKVANGESTTLPCTPPQSMPVPHVNWVIRNRDGGWEPVLLDDRVTMDYEGRLRFTNVVPEDAKSGRPYACKVYNPLLRQAVTGPQYILIVLGVTPVTVPASYMWSSPSDWLALRGEELKLKFICSGNPTPTVQWEKEDGVIADKAATQNGGLELVVPEVELEDGGIYVANCNNSASEFYQRSFHVLVQSAPHWISVPRDVNGHVGDDATVVCETDGIPEAVVHWYVNGLDIEKSQDKRIRSSRFLRPNDTTVVLVKLRESDHMNIQCNATNRHGYAFEDVSIYVTPDRNGSGMIVKLIMLITVLSVRSSIILDKIF